MADDIPGPTGLPFLEAPGPGERRAGRVAVTVVLAIAAGVVAALLAVLLVFGVTAWILSAVHGLEAQDIIRFLTGSRGPDRPLPSYAYELAVIGSLSLAAAGAFVAVTAWRAQRPIRSFLTSAPRFRWRHAVVGLLVYLPIVAVEIAVEAMASPSADVGPLATPGASGIDRLVYAGAALGFLWCAALAEEIVFRGWLLQQTRAFSRNLVVIIAVNGVAFSLAHGDMTLGGFLARLALGVGWAWIVLRLGGVEFTAGAHLANNLGIVLLAQPLLLSPAPPQPFNALSVALQVGTTAALALGVEWWVRRRGPLADGSGPVGSVPDASAT